MLNPESIIAIGVIGQNIVARLEDLAIPHDRHVCAQLHTLGRVKLKLKAKVSGWQFDSICVMANVALIALRELMLQQLKYFDSDETLWAEKLNDYLIQQGLLEKLKLLSEDFSVAIEYAEAILSTVNVILQFYANMNYNLEPIIINSKPVSIETKKSPAGSVRFFPSSAKSQVAKRKTSPMLTYDANWVDNHLVFATAGPQILDWIIPFFQIIFARAENIQAIFALGQGYLPYWLKWEYRNFEIERIVVPDSPYCKLKITRTTDNTVKEVDFGLFDIEDMQSFFLDPLGFNFIKKHLENKVLMHCTAGLGRTGQMRLLLRLLRDSEVRQMLKNIFDAREKFLEQQDRFIEKIITTLSDMRREKTDAEDDWRHAILNSDQFLGVVPQLILYEYYCRLAETKLPPREIEAALECLANELKIIDDKTPLLSTNDLDLMERRHMERAQKRCGCVKH